MTAVKIVTPRVSCTLVAHSKALVLYSNTGGKTSQQAVAMQIVKAVRKQLKGLSVKSSTSSSCIVEIRAKSSSTQTAGQVLQSLAEVCKSAAVAAYCGNLGQLCEASMIEALHNLGLADGMLYYLLMLTCLFPFVRNSRVWLLYESSGEKAFLRRNYDGDATYAAVQR